MVALAKIPTRYALLVGLFLLVVTMTDTVQAKKDLQFCCDELAKYQNLTRSGLRDAELKAIDAVMIRYKERINNLRNMINA